MSPEQARGELDRIGPASDVYSLGATLYALLAGRPPFDGPGQVDLLARVSRGEFPRPREVNARVPPALEAVCLRAMAVRPEDRYPSARALAEEVEHWLADEPVAAYPEPLGLRARRWVGRHRTLVSGAVTAAGVAALLLAVLAVTLQGKNAALASANANERQARTLADASSKKAHGAVNNFYTRVSQQVLLRQPNLQPLRKQLLEDALKYYQDFVEQHQGDVGLRRELAETYFRLARITSDIGSNQDAVRRQRQGLDLAEALVRDNPADFDLRVMLAKAHNQLGIFSDYAGLPADARQAFLRCVELWEGLDRERPGEYPHELAYAYDNLSTFLQHSGKDLAASAEYLEKGQAILERLVKEKPASEEYVRGLAYFYNNRATLLDRQGKTAEALPLHLKALAMRRQLVKDFPNDTRYNHRLYLARSCLRTAGFEAKLGRHDEALAHFREARDLLADMVRKQPALKEPRDSLAECCNGMAQLLRKMGQPSEALTCLDQEREQLEKLVEIDPKDDSYRQRLTDNQRLRAAPSGS
jgi:serine/threonine-protein kinase